MNETNNNFVSYLNTLHNCNAQNQNAFSEKNYQSSYYQDTNIEMDICRFILNAINSSDPQIVILTGHAGDGKTSILYQVLEKLDVQFDPVQPQMEISLEDGRVCLCIKDFSELSDAEKLNIMRKISQYPAEGNTAFMVANTGPLINTFGDLFTDSDEREEAMMDLINAIDENDGRLRDIFNIPITVMNMASYDNTDFPEKYIKKICQESLWAPCNGCSKQEGCHIIRNRNLIAHHMDRVQEFLRKYYIWLNENGTRLTIRSMVEQLAFMITGGLNCSQVKDTKPHRLMFYNLFFGYIGLVENPAALNILAVKTAHEEGLDEKRLRIDEQLIIRQDYTNIFEDSFVPILKEEESIGIMTSNWTKEIHRAFFFLNILGENETEWKKAVEDIFSPQFTEYLNVRNGKNKPNNKQKALVTDGLRMMYYGALQKSSDKEIPVTLSKDDGVSQSVQFILGSIRERDIILEPYPSSVYRPDVHKIRFKLKGSSQSIPMTLPMFDYFDELKSGVIPTVVDPLLSHGIENLKSLLQKRVQKEHDDDDPLEILVMGVDGDTERIQIRINEEENTMELD